MLKNDKKVPVTKELVQQIEEINRAFVNCCDLALQQPLPKKKSALMTDAISDSAGKAVLIEDDAHQKFTSLRKSYAPVAYGSKRFTPAQIKMSIYAREFSAKDFAFETFGHIFRGAPKLFSILTYNKAVNRVFRTPSLCHACDCLSIQSWRSTYPRSSKRLALRLEADPKAKLIMKIQKDEQTLSIENNVQSAGVSE